MSSWGNKPIPKRVQPIINTTYIPPPPIAPLKANSTQYTAEIAFNSTYDTTLQRISTFNETNTDALITFVIPTINRDTLLQALLSIINQSVNNWKVIVIFDGCEPTNPEILQLLSNNRFLYVCINKHGVFKGNIHGAAGFVRNIAMSLVTTPWTGFLDDDDQLLPNYVQSLIEEIKIVPSAELVCFRMSDKELILPPDYMFNIERGYFGISFSYKSVLFQDGFKFTQSEQEDFDFINSIKNAKKKIVISPYITYIVRDSPIRLNVFKRGIIN
jgi:glycosyltransferase involved in cell wall biosynthesis